MIFHVTLSQGRADTLHYQSSSKNTLLSFLNAVSTAVVRNIKEVVYSKAYNINYVKKPPFVPLSVYHKVIVVAYSDNYSQAFTLFNVKKTVTQEILEIEYKKLFINGEQIKGFYDIQFYNESLSNLNIDNLYQVQYSRDSKTYTEDFYSDSYEKVKDFFEKIMDGELLEIRKYVHFDKTIKKDDSDYINRVNVYFDDTDVKASFVLPKVKKSLLHDQLLELIKNGLKIGNKTIDKNFIFVTYK